MEDRPVKVPNADHPITIDHAGMRVIIRVAGEVVADSKHALILREASYPAVTYIPRDEAAMDMLKASAHRTYCPYKGECSYFHVPHAGEAGRDLVWSYEKPHDTVAVIEGYLAFYADRVEMIVEPLPPG